MHWTLVRLWNYFHNNLNADNQRLIPDKSGNLSRHLMVNTDNQQSILDKLDNLSQHLVIRSAILILLLDDNNGIRIDYSM